MSRSLQVQTLWDASDGLCAGELKFVDALDVAGVGAWAVTPPPPPNWAGIAVDRSWIARNCAYL